MVEMTGCIDLKLLIPAIDSHGVHNTEEPIIWGGTYFRWRQLTTGAFCVMVILQFGGAAHEPYDDSHFFPGLFCILESGL